jgi:hypothetical protein
MRSALYEERRSGMADAMITPRVREALKQLGLAEADVFAAKEYPDRVMVVSRAGQKYRWISPSIRIPSPLRAGEPSGPEALEGEGEGGGPARGTERSRRRVAIARAAVEPAKEEDS